MCVCGVCGVYVCMYACMYSMYACVSVCVSVCVIINVRTAKISRSVNAVPSGYS